MRYCLTLLAAVAAAAVAAAIDANGPAHNGKEVRVNLPPERHLRNVGGSDGAGLCVFASLSHAADYQDDGLIRDIFQWMRQYPGGGYPDKVDAMIERLAKQRGKPVPEYVQHTGGDMAFLELALRTGRYPCVTYAGADGVFYRGRIAHMVNLVYLDDSTAAIHDNNYPGKWLWMTRDEFKRRWLDMSGGWAVVLLKPSPPPLPANGVTLAQCPGGRCPSPLAMPLLAAPQPLQWWPTANGHQALYRGDTHLGTFDPSTHLYTRKDGTVDTPPVAPPAVVAPIGAGEVEKNFGIDLARMPKGQTWRKNGRDCDRETVFEAFGDGLIDDSAAPHLTVVGDAATLARFEADVRKPPLSQLLVGYRVHTYPPDHWRVRQAFLAPGVTLHEPADAGGRAVKRWTIDYGGPETLAAKLRGGDTPTPRPDDAAPQRDYATWLLAAALALTWLGRPLLRGLRHLWSRVPCRTQPADVDEILRRLREEMRKHDSA